MLLCMYYTHAQTKVFKEVSEDISSQIRTIRQDNVLVGYIVFTTLEKASADSFNYKITIMDENLNDIGTVNFKEERLNLQAVSFEQDVLCLAYLKSNFIGAEFKGKKEYKEARRNASSNVFIQFLGLDGKIIQSNNVPADVTHENEPIPYNNKYYGAGGLKFDIQLKNIQAKGFVLFFGDENKTNLLYYNSVGTRTGELPVREEAFAYGLLTSQQNVYILCKKQSRLLEGGYILLGYGIDFTDFLRKNLTDGKGNSLKVLSFDNDPVTGKPYLSGCIIDATNGNGFRDPKEVMKGAYAGVFTIDMDGANANEVFTYWNDGSQSFIGPKGQFTEDKSVAYYVESFKDYEGNTYFTGSSYSNSKEIDPILLKQNAKGIITLENTFTGNRNKFISGKALFSNSRKYYSITNSATRTNYLVVDDHKDIFIYNVNQKKVVRQFPHKDGSSYTNVYPAKEGHVMVSEYNKKEKYTRYSIESL
jgi:hypothetical protein